MSDKEEAKKNMREIAEGLVRQGQMDRAVMEKILADDYAAMDEGKGRLVDACCGKVWKRD